MPHVAYDIDATARTFLRSNFIDVNLQHSISKREARPREPVDVVAAGFPCQPFSMLGKQESWSDSLGRGNLVEHTVAFILEKLPPVVILENVVAFVKSDGGRVFDWLTAS